MILLDIPRGSKIFCEVSDDSKYVIYDHPDGMYSYCESEKGNVVHLSLSTPLEKIGEDYKIKTVEN